MNPLLGVELDDRSHQRASRQQRDRFVDKVFRAAGLGLVHVPVRHSYDVGQLAEFLRERISGGEVPDAAPPTTEAEAVKSPDVLRCPDCGEMMVLRTAKSGRFKGNQFWGCSSYPRCRTTRQVTSARNGGA